MKKIMFNDKYDLTSAVLQGRKTMTRRFIKQLLNVENPDISDWGLKDGGKAMITLYEGGRPTTDIFPMCQPGEVVAVAQSYEYMANSGYFGRMMETSSTFKKEYCGAGWNNKMFVRADLMPHQIRITNIKVERLQDISDEDCLREGIQSFDTPVGKTFVAGGVYVGQDARLKIAKGMINLAKSYKTPQEAFAVLIDRVSGKGTWKLNPYVFAYTFELIK